MDAKVFEMISDIQHVLTKIPDEVTSATLRSIKGPEIDLQAINNNIMEPPVSCLIRIASDYFL